MNHGILLVRKPVGITSYDVVRQLKKKFNTQKIGHAGTLDPFASGLLIVGINEGVKILSYLLLDTKEYIAELTLGIATDTFDNTGKITKQESVKEITKDEVIKTLNSFVGEIEQTPPIYSAIAVNGKRLYQYAREGKAVEIKKRKQHILDIRLIHFEDNKIIFYVKVDKGTYIRSLGVDIAAKLGTIGHLSNLERNGIGIYPIAMSKKVEQLTERNIIPLENCLELPKYECYEENKIKNGQPLKIENHDEPYIMITHNNKAMAIYAYNNLDKMYYSKRGFYYGSV